MDLVTSCNTRTLMVGFVDTGLYDGDCCPKYVSTSPGLILYKKQPTMHPHSNELDTRLMKRRNKQKLLSLFCPVFSTTIVFSYCSTARLRGRLKMHGIKRNGTNAKIKKAGHEIALQEKRRTTAGHIG